VASLHGVCGMRSTMIMQQVKQAGRAMMTSGAI
jgi:hypothetical protein